MKNEFDFIMDQLYQSSSLDKKNGDLTLGDDCSVQTLGNGFFQIVTMDSLVEGVHFLKNTSSFEDIGRKALSASLSDVAAMGGTPLSCYLAMAWPKTTSHSSVSSFLNGFKEVAREHRVELLGGDTTASLRDLFINVCVLGTVHQDHIKLRKKFRPNEILCFLGNLGYSHLGLQYLKRENSFLAGEFEIDGDIEKFIEDCKESHRNPRPLLREGQWLGRQSAVGGMMDISDGLLESCFQLEKFFKVGFELYVDQIPNSNLFAKACEILSLDTLACRLEGGEDYGLLFSVKEKDVESVKMQFEDEFSMPLIVIGEVTSQGVKVLQDQKNIVSTFSTFNHFDPRE